MGRRGGKGTGTVFFDRRRRKWVAQLTIGHDPATGRPRKLSKVFPTRKEAEAWRVDQAARLHKGLLGSPEGITLREWASRWLEGKAREVRPKSLHLYRQELAYAMPSLKDPKAKDPLGSLRLRAIQPAHIRAVVDSLLDRGLSPRTVQKVRQRLFQVFEEALALEVIARNPVAPVKVRAPKSLAPQRTGRSLEEHEALALLAALDHHPDRRTALALRLCLALGLRKGEVLGLQWGDIDLEEGVLTVRRSWVYTGKEAALSHPKTPTSIRTVPIPQATLARLRGYWDWWREKLGANPPPEAWVFPGNRGDRPLDLNALNHTLRRIADRLGLGRVRVHDLRHTYGSLLLAKGAPLELVAERMGHANPNITLGVYRHVLEKERRGWVLDPEDLAGPRGQA
ncbi:site-specific integrase [Thermus sp.]|uniref:tyrosine-type recombinase/integrase n=1 Tax=Thermus sp. TaxID=275 RepID=UPI0025CE5F27|nr:site-specific integrase [Thermus sp.]MCS6867811.1 site-specific integrase [Thermus sp.]MDW8358678.1 tyrosine-type recombinase/integrase [Thermus sp.]